MKEKDTEFDSYVLEDDAEEIRHYTMWSLIPRTMVMPASGWQRTFENGPLPEIAVIRFLLPMCILSGLSEFFVYFYQVQLSFSSVLVSAVIIFCSFFIGYFLALLLAQIAMPKEARQFAGTDTAKLMIMTGIGTLALFHILFMALPMFDFILEFLPLWTVYILYEGMRKNKVSETKQTYATAALCVAVICSPMLIEWLLAAI